MRILASVAVVLLVGEMQRFLPAGLENIQQRLHGSAVRGSQDSATTAIPQARDSVQSVWRLFWGVCVWLSTRLLLRAVRSLTNREPGMKT